MHKFFIGFLIIFAIAGVAYRLNIDMNKVEPVKLVTYTDEELGITLQYPEGVKIKVDSPILIPPGSTPLQTMAKSSIMDGSGMNPNESQFVREVSPYTTIYYVPTGRFEALVSFDGYVTRNNFIIPIRYSWEESRWSDPTYETEKDPRFKIFLDALRSVQFINTDPGEYEGARQ